MQFSKEDVLEIIGTKVTKLPKLIIQNNLLTVYERKESYLYLGKSISIECEDKEQVGEIKSKLTKHKLKKICESELPLRLKVSAINEMALAKILHHFDNTCVSVKDLEELDKFLNYIHLLQIQQYIYHV